MSYPADAQELYVTEFQNSRDQEWEWFWGFATLREAQACAKEYAADRKGGPKRKARVSKWKRAK